METMTLILFLVASVLASSVINQLVERATLPLVQIAMGILIATFAKNSIMIDLDPEVFLLVFIAPLLYIEAKHADRLSLWKNLKPILGLSVGLVIVTSIAIGFALSAIVPAVSIWAALALGAALGPTDAVAVTSLAKSVNIPKREYAILKGELLLNDASGIVMFQVAIAAASVGTVNFTSAGINFLIEFFGGLALGALFGIFGKYALLRARGIGIDSTVFHVLFELCMPFIVYLASNSLHVSGIIAVVTSGLINPISVKATSPAVARMNIVSDSVWDVLSFALNGVVFVLLGTQIPTAMFYVWEDPSISNLVLLFLIFLVTFILMFVRFIWCFVMSKIREKQEGVISNCFSNALLMTLSGAKGTITLSILFTIPFFLSNGEKFFARDLIIFIGCGVILLTLLLATFVLPHISPKPVDESSDLNPKQYYAGLQSVLRSVIEQLTSHEGDFNRASVRQIIKSYQQRLIYAEFETFDDDNELNELRVSVCRWQQEKAFDMIENHEVSENVGYAYLDRLSKVERLLTHEKFVKQTKFHNYHITLRMFLGRFKRNLIRLNPKSAGREDDSTVNLKVACDLYAIDKLKEIMITDEVASENASKIVLELEASISSSSSKLPSVTSTIRAADNNEDVLAYAYELELDAISELQQTEKITRAQAKKMRENVFLMQLELKGAI